MPWELYLVESKPVAVCYQIVLEFVIFLIASLLWLTWCTRDIQSNNDPEAKSLAFALPGYLLGWTCLMMLRLFGSRIKEKFCFSFYLASGVRFMCSAAILFPEFSRDWYSVAYGLISLLCFVNTIFHIVTQTSPETRPVRRLIAPDGRLSDEPAMEMMTIKQLEKYKDVIQTYMESHPRYHENWEVKPKRSPSWIIVTSMRSSKGLPDTSNLNSQSASACDISRTSRRTSKEEDVTETSKTSMDIVPRVRRTYSKLSEITIGPLESESLLFDNQRTDKARDSLELGSYRSIITDSTSGSSNTAARMLKSAMASTSEKSLAPGRKAYADGTLEITSPQLESRISDSGSAHITFRGVDSIIGPPSTKPYSSVLDKTVTYWEQTPAKAQSQFRTTALEPSRIQMRGHLTKKPVHYKEPTAEHRSSEQPQKTFRPQPHKTASDNLSFESTKPRLAKAKRRQNLTKTIMDLKLATAALEQDLAKIKSRTNKHAPPETSRNHPNHAILEQNRSNVLFVANCLGSGSKDQNDAKASNTEQLAKAIIDLKLAAVTLEQDLAEGTKTSIEGCNIKRRNGESFGEQHSNNNQKTQMTENRNAMEKQKSTRASTDTIRGFPYNPSQNHCTMLVTPKTHRAACPLHNPKSTPHSFRP